MLNQKEPEIEKMEYFWPIHMARNEKAYSEENTKDVTEGPTEEQMTHVTQELHQSSQKKKKRPEIEMGLYH